MTKYALDLYPGKLTKSQYSHKLAWAMLRKCQLEDALDIKIDVLNGESWDDYDTIFLYHSMEQDGETLNLFGGASKDNAIYYDRILRYQDKNFISLDIPMPDYGKLCKSRLKNCDEYWGAVDWDKVSELCNKVEFLQHPEVTTKLVMGDSHSFSAYQPGYMTFRRDGRTLSGVLKKSIQKEINDFMPDLDISSLTHLTCYYGNIDIRHHWMRETDPETTMMELVTKLEFQLKLLNIPNIELVEPLPIEDESRKLPKTGWFKGTPFFGSQQERNELRRMYKAMLTVICERNGWKLFTWPEEWYIIKPIEFMQTYMERPKSVHCAPLFHRHDYWNNTPRVHKPNPITNLIEF